MAKSSKSGENRVRRTADRLKTTEAVNQTPAAVIASDRSGLTEGRRTAGPSPDDIAARAYELYVARGAEHGLDLQDWLQAESELRTHRV